MRSRYGYNWNPRHVGRVSPTKDLLKVGSIPSLQDLAHKVRSHSSGQYSWQPLCSRHQQATRNTVQTCPEPVCLEKVCPRLIGLYAPATVPGFVFLSAAPGVPKRSPIQALNRFDLRIRMGTGPSNMVWSADLTDYCDSMGSFHCQVAVMVPDEKLNCFDFWHFFFKTKRDNFHPGPCG